MKLRHIIFASLAVCALASCSKDEVITPTTPETPQAVDAYVSFQAVPDNVKTRAGVDAEVGTDAENKVTSLSVYIFKADGGAFVNSKFVQAKAGETISQIDHVLVKIVPGVDGVTSSETFQAVFIANAPLVTGVASLSDLNTKTLSVSLTDISNVSLPMVNKAEEIKFSGLKVLNESDTKKNENWVDNSSNTISGTHADNVTAPTNYKPIELERLVARVQVESITAAFDAKYGDNAQFTLEHLSLVNVATSTTIGEENTPADYVKGYKSDAYAQAQGWIKPSSGVNDYLVKEYTSNNVFTKDTEIKFTGESLFSKYIFTNPAGAEFSTALLISGKFTRNKNDLTTYPAEERHYRVYLNSANVLEGAAVSRNTIYKLYVTIDGEGSKNEDNIETTAGVQVKVVAGDWRTITQEEEITN